MMTGNRKPFTVSKNRKDVVNVENDPSLIDLPPELIQLIGSRLYIKGKGRYVKSCRIINNLFQPALDEEAEPWVKLALHCAAYGKKDALAALLKKRPGLAYLRGTTIDPCGRTVHGTVYRIALGAKDWSPFPGKFKETAEMIEDHMKKLLGGEEEIALQKSEQFPEGWEKAEKAREEKDSAELKKVFTAIGHSRSVQGRVQAVERFITYLKSQNEVKTGYHFNDKLLSEAYALFKKHFVAFGGHASRHNRLLACMQSHRKHTRPYDRVFGDGLLSGPWQCNKRGKTTQSSSVT